MRSNSIKTVLLLSTFTVMLVFIGSLAGGRNGAITAFIIALLMNFFSYWFSASIVLKMYNAQPVSEADNPILYNMVKSLAERANIPMPQVCIIDNPTPNAFATGRNPQHSVVAVTTGIMRLLNNDELEGVLAHEISHITGRDILISTIAATMAGAVMLLSRLALFTGGGGDDENHGNAAFALIIAILAPIAAMIVQMAISRTREYEADANGAKLTGNPLALASALEKISYGVQRAPMNDANPSTAHMFILNPLSSNKLKSIFSTHPDTEDRIERLRQMSGNMRSGMGGGVYESGKNRNNPMFR